MDGPYDPIAMAVKKEKPLVTNLPHARKVIDEAPPEYIIMIVVAFLQVFAMTISLVHIASKHRAYARSNPGMVFPTVALLSFYWVIATLNLVGLFVLRANLLCQAICSCYEAMTGYLLAVLLVTYCKGKLSYMTVVRWRDIQSTSSCCGGVIARPHAIRAVTYISQLILVHCATSLAELICENEGLFFYPSPITKSYIIFGLRIVQFVSIVFAMFGFTVLCRGASIVAPRTLPYTKLALFKCIYILAAVQNNVLLYLAFDRTLPAVSDIAPITRAVVWGNFATVTECTLAYFIAVRVYGTKAYRDQSKDDVITSYDRRESDTCSSELEMDKQDMLRNLKSAELCQAAASPLNQKKRGSLRKGGTCRSVDTVLTRYAPPRGATEEAEGGEPKISIVGGKVNISLSSKDLVKLCKARDRLSVDVSLDDLLNVVGKEEEEEEEEIPRSKVNNSKDGKSRHSMQFVKSFSYSHLNSSDEEEEEEEEGVEELVEHWDEHTARAKDPSQYVSRISLV